MWTTASTQHCVTDLTAHWRATADIESDFGALGSHRPIDLLARVRDASDLDARDRLAHELVQLAKSGHSAADQLLLVAMLPRVVHLTRTSRGLRALRVRDAQAIALGAMWEAIRIHPDTRPVAVLHRLGLDALGIITRTHSTAEKLPEVAMAPDTLGLLQESLQQEASTSTLEDLATLLRWGVDSGVVTRDDVRVIAAVDLGAAGDREALAAELGVAPASLTRRAHRIRVLLRGAVGAEIERVGSW